MLFWLSLSFVALGALGLLVWLLVLRPVVVRVPDELPPGFEEGFSHASFEDLLERFVESDGKVRYGAWHDDAEARKQLERYLAALARFSPDNAPGRFADDAARLAYWLNAYNALVIHAVLMHWPIESVNDVQAPLEPKQGLGFFYRLRFVLGGREINLQDLENEIIRKRFPDPRVHFVLNCGSEGCPVIQPKLPEGPELERTLAAATREFLADPNHVSVDDDSNTVTLSSIFDWYAEDFLADLQRRGVPATDRTILRWIRDAAPEDVAEALDRGKDYAIRFGAYDWSLNGTR